MTLKEIFEELEIAEKIKVPTKPARKGIQNTVFHFDPEVQTVENMRSYAAFGQSGSSASHLLNHVLQPGDVFLFSVLLRKPF